MTSLSYRLGSGDISESVCELQGCCDYNIKTHNFVGIDSNIRTFGMLQLHQRVPRVLYETQKCSSDFFFAELANLDDKSLSHMTVSPLVTGYREYISKTIIYTLGSYTAKAYSLQPPQSLSNAVAQHKLSTAKVSSIVQNDIELHNRHSIYCPNVLKVINQSTCFNNEMLASEHSGKLHRNSSKVMWLKKRG